MKPSTVAFVLAGVLALVAVAASAPAVNDPRAAPLAATKATIVAASFAVILGVKASVGDTGERMVVATYRHEERGAPQGPVDQPHHRRDFAVQVSVDDLYDRSRKASQERASL